MEKKPVYNGYKEKYLTGSEIVKLFSASYECFGKHHGQISSHRINFGRNYAKIKSDTTYRVFLNDIFCIIFDNETDKKIYFFGYTNEKPAWAQD